MLKEVMMKERDAITQMIEEADNKYDEILDLFANCQGKLVFMGVGKSGLYEEFFRITGKTKSEMLSYRDHPIDRVPTLLENDIPVVLVAGDSDRVVPYTENGALLARYYEEKGGRIRVFLKKGCDHHPHGMENGGIVADAIEEFLAYKG